MTPEIDEKYVEAGVCPFSLPGTKNGEFFSNCMHCGEDECELWNDENSCCEFKLASKLLKKLLEKIESLEDEQSNLRVENDRQFQDNLNYKINHKE